jgi:glutathione S-transferase
MDGHLKLYDFERSGNCHKVRLMLSLLHQPYESVRVDITGQEPPPPEFGKLSPRAQVPVLVDGEVALWDSTAILVYLARCYGGESWLGEDAVGEAEVMQWLALAQNEILYGLARARSVKLLGRPWNMAEARQLGATALDVLEGRLTDHDWLVRNHLTIADIACYPYVALAHEGDISLEPYPAVRHWLQRIEALDGYMGMQGIETDRD